jgi:DDE superfamily endonuclease
MDEEFFPSENSSESSDDNVADNFEDELDVVSKNDSINNFNANLIDNLNELEEVNEEELEEVDGAGGEADTITEKSTVKPKRRSFSLTRKIELVREATLTSPTIVGKKYGIDWRNIVRWKRAIDNNDTTTNKVLKMRNNSAPKFRFAGGGRKSKVPQDVDDHMREFLREHRGKDFSVSVRMLAMEYKRVDPTATDDNVSFHALRQRILRRTNQWDFSIRRKTHIAQLTRLSESVITDFQRYVNWKIRMLEVSPANVYNADQTNVFYSMPSNTTLAPRGSTTVSIRGAKSTSRLTVMLCANMEGGKVPPYLIFKGSVKDRAPINREITAKSGHPENMEYAVQPKAWMDEAKMIDWIERVWAPHIGRQQPAGVSYLLLDECRSHLTAKVKSAFERCNTEVDYIPGGYTSKCQMLDVGVNRPFKNNIVNEFTQWMITTGSDKPSRQDVSRWINNSWNSISVPNIKNSWRKVGIKFEESNNGEGQGDNMDIEAEMNIEANSYHSENDEDALG